jgi:hypothetical protein
MRVGRGRGESPSFSCTTQPSVEKRIEFFMQTICSYNLNDLVLFPYQEKFSRPFAFREKQFSSAIFSTSADDSSRKMICHTEALFASEVSVFQLELKSRNLDLALSES